MIAVALVAAAIASVWVWRVFTADGPASVTRAEASASYYPEDAVAYAWMTLEPGEGPFGSLLPMLGQFDELEGVPGLTGGGESMLPDGIGAVLGEIGTWLGTEVSAGVVDLEDQGVGVAITLGVRDSDAAAEFLHSWLHHQETGASTSFERHVVGDGVIWVGGGNEWMEEQAYAQAGDLLLFATDRGLLEEVLDRVDGDHRETLASAERFEEARAAARDGRFASAYVDLEWLAGKMGDPDRTSCPGALFDRPEWLMVSADWVGDGLVVDMATPDMTSWWTDTSAGVTDAVVPADALGFVSMGFDPDIDRWREVMGSCEIADLIPGGYLFDLPSEEDRSFERGATLADALDLALGFVDLGTGLDLEADLFDQLGGQLVIAAHSAGGEGSSLEGAASLSYRPLSANALEGTMDGIAGGVSTLTGVSLRQVDLGASRSANLMEGGKPLSLGYVLHDGFLTFGTSAGALETTLAVQEGTRDSVSDTDRYRRVGDHIPYDPLLLAYVDLAQVIGLMGSSGMGPDDGLFGMLSGWLGPIALGVGTDGDYSRATLVVSFSPSMDAFMDGAGGS